MKTITLAELKKINSSSFAVKDSSPRGIKFVYKNDIKAGDCVVIDNHFIQVIDK